MRYFILLVALATVVAWGACGDDSSPDTGVDAAIPEAGDAGSQDAATPDAGNPDAAAPDAAASDAAVGPPGWACDARAYGDGLICDCECGVPDPDCEDTSLLVSNCLLGQVCANDACTWCGNGEVEIGEEEECDAALSDVAECASLGYQPGQVPCSATCTWDYDQCVPLATCGNGQLDSGEHCDGSLVDPARSCADYSFAQGTLACADGCVIDSSGCYTCGNGTIEGPESCDDRDASGEDGCSSSCSVESGWLCDGEPSACSPVCGDGQIVGFERCDDSNTDAGDGCSASCFVEQGCVCDGAPSSCSCLRTETIATHSAFDESPDTGSLVLDSSGRVQVAYMYATDFTDPDTGYLRELARAIHAERVGTTWTVGEISRWEQTRTVLEPGDFQLAHDDGALRLFFHRIYHPDGPFAEATRNGDTWQLAYDDPYYIYQVIRGGGAWHGIIERTRFGSYNYVAGAPGAFAPDESLSFASGTHRLGYATNDDVYLATMRSPSNDWSYTLELRRRIDATDWSLDYADTTNAVVSQVFSVDHRALALADGNMAILDDAFDCAGQRWLRAHNMTAGGAAEMIADLSGYSFTCYSGGSRSWSEIRKVTALDPAGRPHVLLAAADDESVIDYYRDAAGWTTRSLPLVGARPLDMVIDAGGNTHLLVVLPGPTNSGTIRLSYVLVGPSFWTEP